MPFSTSGDEQMPWKGQSFARPAASLSCAACHMNWPSDSRNAIRTPLSPLTSGSLFPSLLVPTKTIPAATTGFPYACEPSSATHLMFFLVLTSQLVGSPFMLDSMLRSGVPPHIGQSAVGGSPARASSVREVAAMTPADIRESVFMDGVCFSRARVDCYFPSFR